ncbi:MAG: hypothetical protein ACTTKS_02315 [Bulleidia sp.]
MEEKVDERNYLTYVELPNLINRIAKLIMAKPFSWMFLKDKEKELKKIVSSEFQGAIKAFEDLKQTHID